MFSAFSIPFSNLFSSNSSTDPGSSMLPQAKVHDIESATDKTTKRLQSLLRLNHANHAIIYHDLQFHNHTPHASLPNQSILGSSYILGATPDQLTNIYEAESAELEPWSESPGEISVDDWRDFLGKRNYQRAYIDFFEDQLVAFGYDWHKLLDHYLYEGEAPLVNGLISGLAHPLIHVGYAYELSSRTVAIEALALTTCFHSPLHKYLDDPKYTKPSYSATCLLEILKNVAEDSRLNSYTTQNTAQATASIMAAKEEAILHHWNAWTPSAETLHDDLRAAQQAAVLLTLGTVNATAGKHDFFLLHGLTASHAVRILVSRVPAKLRVPLVRQWFLFAILAYVREGCPSIDASAVDKFKPKEGEASWKYVKHVALEGAHATDPHFVKGLRTCLAAEETWGDDGGFWLRAGCKFAAEFDGWAGAGLE